VKVFISWSGEPSHAVALAIRDWLPSVIQNIKPYVSSEDIDKGAPWFTEIAQELNDTAFGIICVTRANAESRWLNFEAGALFKSVENVKSRVSPLLIDLKSTELVGPLAQLQTTEPNRNDVTRLVKLFDTHSEQPIGVHRVEAAMGKWWQDLEKQLEAARKSAETQAQPERRDPQDMIEEILEISRSLQGRVYPNPLSLMRYGSDVRTEVAEEASRLAQISAFVGALLALEDASLTDIRIEGGTLRLTVNGPVREDLAAIMGQWAADRFSFTTEIVEDYG
jgi:hypothetical protein